MTIPIARKIVLFVNGLLPDFLFIVDFFIKSVELNFPLRLQTDKIKTHNICMAVRPSEIAGKQI